ncbi:retrotransposon-related protein [Tanacetum coccineum]
MKKEVKEWIKTCVVCQRFKPELVPSPRLLQPLPILERVWTHISMDFIDGFLVSKGKSVLLVVVDRLSKYSYFILLTHQGDSVTPIDVAEDRGDRSLLRSTNTGTILIFHTSINTTPYQVLYGQSLLAHVTYTTGDSANKSVDKSLVAREAVVQLLKFHLLRAQDRMKAMANKKRTERVFRNDDLVLLKLKPYRIGECDPRRVIALEPFAVLNRRMAKRGNVAAVYVLI